MYVVRKRAINVTTSVRVHIEVGHLIFFWGFEETFTSTHRVTVINAKIILNLSFKRNDVFKKRNQNQNYDTFFFKVISYLISYHVISCFKLSINDEPQSKAIF